MDNTREKLINLLSTAGWNLYTSEQAKQEIADHLIANGVTFAKDINVPTKKKPVKKEISQETLNALATMGRKVHGEV